MDLNFSDEYLKLLKATSEVALIAYINFRGKIIFANENFCKISGYSLEELQEQNHRILNSNYHSREVFIDMYKKLLSTRFWRGEIKNRKKDGSYYWMDVQIIPVSNEKNKIESFSLVCFDITERKKKEESLIHANKLNFLGEISAAISHEVNNPLAIINLCTTSLINKLDQGSINQINIEQKLKKIAESSKRISNFVRDLKSLSQPTHKKEFDIIELKSFIEKVLSFSIHKCIEHSINFKLSKIPEVKLECRPDQIAQVLINLITNAQEATLCLDERWIELSIEVNFISNELIFCIRDSGPGIPEKIADKILSPFFTTKEADKRSGLGLSICKTIIEEHSGELFLDKKDKNTLFIFKIPLKHYRFINVA